MKSFFKKHWDSIVEFFIGADISYVITTFIIEPDFNSIPLVVSAGIGLIAQIAIITIAIVKTLRKNKLIKVEPTEDEISYVSPFPEIDQNPGQSQIVQRVMDHLQDKYGFPGCLEVNELGKIIIGAEVPTDKVDEQGNKVLEFIEISELTLTPPDLEVDSLDWKVTAEHILEDFEDKCKIVLGEYK